MSHDSDSHKTQPAIFKTQQPLTVGVYYFFQLNNNGYTETHTVIHQRAADISVLGG